MRKKFTMLLASLFLVMGTAWAAETATTHADGLYKIYWKWDERGYLAYHNTEYPTMPQLAGVVHHNPNGHYALGAEGISLGWYLYTSPKTGKSYLFEATTGKFITFNPADFNIASSKQCLLSTEVTDYAMLNLLATDNGSAPAFALRYVHNGTNYQFCSGCGSNKGQNPVRFATNGQDDGGIPFKFVEDNALTIADAIKNAAIAKIKAFENKMVLFDVNSDSALPGTLTNGQYTWKSSEITAPADFNTLRLTFIKNTNESGGVDRGGFPHVALAEFYLYDKEGQTVSLVDKLSSNATETNEGKSGLHELCDGNTTKQTDEGAWDWYWHSYWSANAGAYHYLEVDVTDITADLSTFAIGYVSRESNGTPAEILVTTGSSSADVAAQYNSYMIFGQYDLSAQAFRIKNSNITDEDRYLTIETPNLNNRDEDGVKILPKRNDYENDSEAQAWKFIPQSDGTYRIQSESGYFLNNHGGWGINAEDDTQGHELDNPKFTLEYLKDGEFRIKSASGYVGPNNSYSTDHPYEMFGNHTNDKQYIDWKVESYTKQYIITCEYVLGDKSVSTTSYCVAGETYSFSNPYEFTTVASCTKNGDALTASDGTYSFTVTEHTNITVVLEENLPFTPTTITAQGAFADNTEWYILMQKNTNNYWKYHSEGNNNVRATASGNNNYDEKQMWCFTGNVLEGFKIYNKALGTNHSLSNDDPAKLVENNTQTWYARESGYAFTASDRRFGLARPGKTGNSEYANLQTADDLLKGWSLDAGSTTCAVSITEKYAEIAAAWEKLLTIEEGAIGSLATTEGFQALIDAYKANPSQETENAVNEFIAANALELESDKYYMIVSAYDAFKNNQGVEKAIYSDSDNSDLKWATRDNASKAYYWQAVTEDGQLRFKNCNDGSYMAVKTTTTESSTSTDIVMWNGVASADASVSYNAKFEVGTTNVLTQLNINLGNGGNLHANSHGSGGGKNGNIIFYGSGANGASAWRLIKTEHPDLVALKNKVDELELIIDNAGKVGYYTTEVCDELQEYVTIALEVLNGESINSADYTAALTALNEGTASVEKAIVLPEAGKFYRIKGKASGKYMSTPFDNETNRDKMRLAEYNENNLGIVFYLYEGNKLLSYKTGKFLNNTYDISAIGAKNGNTISFNKSESENLGYFTLKTDFSGSKYIYDDVDGNEVDRNGSYAQNHCEWAIEEVTTLPVTLSTIGESSWATLYAPVALSIPTDDVTAYTGTVEGEWLTLTKVEDGVIPAETAVILQGTKGAGSQNFAITTTTTATTIDGNKLAGTVATIEASGVAGTIYTLQREQKKDENGNVVGYLNSVVFGQYTGDYLNGFRAYLDFTANPTSAKSISIRFEGTTDIEHSEIRNQHSEMIFDLLGRRVEAITKGGIYIVNGKKVVVK